MTDKTVKLLSTFFYVGYCPVAPGSLASLAGTLIYVFIHGQPLVHVFLFILVTWIGFAVSGKMEELVKEKDPSCVVIDEVSGILLSFFLLPINPATVFTTFFLFRAFDMFKIYPGNRFEAMGGGFGIMMDDISAGVYTNIIMQIAVHLIGIK
ncbi:MAG: phosphatidylglycerophosphatase A [Candidatus Omnitrophica bacterium]|nr:phosphatidylglycerophosphatase A [Candidatus Omnitrophota bacterium]